MLSLICKMRTYGYSYRDIWYKDWRLCNNPIYHYIVRVCASIASTHCTFIHWNRLHWAAWLFSTLWITVTVLLFAIDASEHFRLFNAILLKMNKRLDGMRFTLIRALQCFLIAKINIEICVFSICHILDRSVCTSTHLSVCVCAWKTATELRLRTTSAGVAFAEQHISESDENRSTWIIE